VGPEVKRVRSNIDLPNRGAKSTTKKSKYFEPESSDEPGLESDASQGATSGSAYEEGKESSSDEAEPEEPSESEEDTKPKAGPKGSSRQSASSVKGQELWREGVRAGLGPGKEVIIAKPKARDAGNTPYEDETLHPNTKLFLIDLAENNDREWMKGKWETSLAGMEWLADSAQRTIRITARQRRTLRRSWRLSHPRYRRWMPPSPNFLQRTW
jgi:hypothetical protein